MCIKIHVLGSKGKMGSRVTLLAQQTDFSITDEWNKAHVAIDFTSPTATKEILKEAVGHRKPLVIGTTGHSVENFQDMEKAALTIPLLFSPNFSLGISVCLQAAKMIAEKLQEAATIEIIEAHHAEKKDRPSGTALALEKAVGKKSPIHSIRAGDIVGDHTVVFALNGERIELKHQAHSRDAFAHGALKAAKFLLDKPAGLYSLKDML
jgi:4-hydroxy-tetrahydrodipicolinate reductase